MRLQGLRTLVIEDVADIRDVFVMLLHLEEADVVAAGSGREGVEIANKLQFDVILTDLGLPDMAGDTIIREMRNSAGGSHALVVAITGYGEPYVSQARHAGADAVFMKPIEWTDLVEYVRQSVPLAA